MNMRIFNSANMKLNAVCLILFFLISQASAQSTIENVTLNSGDNGSVKINFEVAGEVTEPQVFSTNMPPRLALDFDNTANNSAQSNQMIGIGQAKGLRVVSAGSKTRAVIDLMGPAEHTITKSGQTLTVTLLPSKQYQQTAAQGTVEINDIDFRRGLDGQGIIELGLSNPNAIINISENQDKVVVEIANASLIESLDMKMDVVDFATPVKFIDVRQRGNDVKIEIEASGSFDKMAYQAGNDYTVEVSTKKAE